MSTAKRRHRTRKFTPLNLEPTEQQLRIYQWIFAYTMARGFQPSYREIMNQFEYASVQAIVGPLDSLRRKGYLGSRPLRGGPSRAIVFLRKPDGDPFRGLTPI